MIVGEELLSWLVPAAYVLYLLFLGFIFLYSLTQFQLLRSASKKLAPNQPKPLTVFPSVTIQLPVYNERYVVERLIKSVCSIDYPLDKLEIQVLDDSTDDTSEIVENSIQEFQNKGIDIKRVTRPNREGFKAGALAFGLEKAKGEFIAIFDADFLPQPDFLKKTLPHFTHSEVGMVQTRWEHINGEYSLLTQLQAFGLDAHFHIEQTGRNRLGSFINFNGTAGVWRKSCIVDAGNWQADTLTEDLDLSYRAQMKGWQFVYRDEIGAPAELPPVMTALKSQQYRWTKGGAEVAKKHLGNLFSLGLPKQTKWHAVFHLLNGAMFISLIGAAVVSVFLLWGKQQVNVNRFVPLAAPLFISFFILSALYHRSCRLSGKSTGEFLRLFPSFLTVMMGLSLHNSRAVLQGYWGKQTAFIRTPKFNLSKEKSWAQNSYFNRKDSGLLALEALLALGFSFAVYQGLLWKDFTFILFHLMMALGFFFVVIVTLKERFSGN